MESVDSRYVLIREDSQYEPVELIADGIRIGRLPTCDLVLNHPSVLGLHAGVTKAGGRFYFYSFGTSSRTSLNGRAVQTESAEVLADGDILRLGPFNLHVAREADALTLRVTTEDAPDVGEDDGRVPFREVPYRDDAREEEREDFAQALNVFWDKRKREAGKMKRVLPLRPQKPMGVLGKIKFNWTPTRDLIPSWPIAIFTWSFAAVTLLTVVAVLRYPEFFRLGGWPTDKWEGAERSLFNSLTQYKFLLYGVGVATLLTLVLGTVKLTRGMARLRQLSEEPLPPRAEEDDGRIQLTAEQLEKYDPEGPDYPHPVVITERCIGCHACVDACPHDVLAIVGGIATPVASDQCMEDTACQVECPVNPKACIVVNTTKKIPPRKVPNRDARFMTNVEGCYIVGDVSGEPLVKNATNEGADCLYYIRENLRHLSPEPKADVDVAIIGVGPAGLSAAITAQRLGIPYVAIERDRVLSTIEAYPANKYVFFKPDTLGAWGGIRAEGAGQQREELLEAWARVMRESGVRVNESEICESVKRAADGDYFVVQTEKGYDRTPVTYNARRVVLALGLRGTPMRLRVPGEALRVTRDGKTYDKVMYKLANPGAFRSRKIIVVGAGNSAIEAAVDLVATRDGDYIFFRPYEEINEVTLVIRSDMKNDLKFRNKQQVYDCIDEGRIKVYFGTSLKEIRDSEVVLQNARTGEVKATVPNDFIFAMIGGDRPTKFLESIGVKIG